VLKKYIGETQHTSIELIHDWGHWAPTTEIPDAATYAHARPPADHFEGVRRDALFWQHLYLQLLSHLIVFNASHVAMRDTHALTLEIGINIIISSQFTSSIYLNEFDLSNSYSGILPLTCFMSFTVLGEILTNSTNILINIREHFPVLKEEKLKSKACLK